MSRKALLKSKDFTPSAELPTLQKAAIQSRLSEATNGAVDRMPLQQYFVPNFKAKSKSRANALVMEFLSRVFAGDGASRFFKTFLLRFLFDGGSQSSDDGSGTMAFAPAL